MRAVLLEAADAFAEPITVTEFRQRYRDIGNASAALRRQCNAVGRWVQDHYEQ
jgi:hypothetical protein